jgi:hypothetical protein
MNVLESNCRRVYQPLYDKNRNVGSLSMCIAENGHKHKQRGKEKARQYAGLFLS